MHASPLRILLIPDKFKGSLSSRQVARSLTIGLRAAHPSFQITALPLSDGGEGFVETLTAVRQGRLTAFKTTDPLGRPCRARYGLLPDGTAVVGLTEASGMGRVPLDRRNPGTLSVRGTGELLKRLADQDCPRVIIGLGGSATNDGGIGLAAPLGFQFLDSRDRPIPLNGEGLGRLVKIIPPVYRSETEYVVATDVTNPLYGPLGAAFQFAPQKGARPEQVRRLDRHLQQLAKVAHQSLGRSLHRCPGAGAAGGCGYGLMTFLRARQISGFDLFREWTDLESLIARHDVVVTGEGRLDQTSTGGKGPWALAQLAKRQGKPVWAVCGSCTLEKTPFEGVMELLPLAPNLITAQKRGAYYLRRIAFNLAQVLLHYSKARK